MLNSPAQRFLAELPPAFRASAEREADMDLLARLSAGSIVYPAMLLLIGITTPYRTDHPSLFWSIVGATVLGLAMRIAVRVSKVQLYSRSPRLFMLLLLVSVALCGSASGLLLLTVSTAYGFASWPFSITMLWMAGIVSGSTISFTPRVRFLVALPLTVLLLFIVYSFLTGTSYGLSLGMATSVFCAFHFVQGYRLNGMYWALCSGRYMEKLRMQELDQARRAAERAQEKLQYQATHDPLTGVLNRAQILSVFDRELERSIQNDEPLGILMLDLDHFKQVNDRFGHLGGDQALRTFAALVRQTIRSADAMGRYGGEEFLILMPNLSLADCAACAGRIRQAIESQPVVHDDSEIRMTVSIGVTVLHPKTDLFHRHMIARADRALYRAKSMGRNRVEVDSLRADPASLNN